MTTDWIAEAQRVVCGRRLAEPGILPSGRNASQVLPLSEKEVTEAEAELGITLPGDYRDYLLRQGASGTVRGLYRSPAGWGWQGDRETNYGLLATAFPHPGSYRDYEADLDGREPLEGSFPDFDAYQAAWRSWDAECEMLQERKASGAVFIQENGCGFFTLLIVAGPYRGTMWFDARATCDQILPLNLGGRVVSFTDWLGRNSMDLLGW
jgi:hypothetical protein